MWNKPIARFVTRMLGDGDGLILGAALKSGIEHFEPSTVYEAYVQEMTGDIVLRKVGPSFLRGGEEFRETPDEDVKFCQDHSKVSHWAQEYQSLPIYQGPSFWLSAKEMRAQIEMAKDAVKAEGYDQ